MPCIIRLMRSDKLDRLTQTQAGRHGHGCRAEHLISCHGMNPPTYGGSELFWHRQGCVRAGGCTSGFLVYRSCLGIWDQSRPRILGSAHTPRETTAKMTLSGISKKNVIIAVIVKITFSSARVIESQDDTWQLVRTVTVRTNHETTRDVHSWDDIWRLVRTVTVRISHEMTRGQHLSSRGLSARWLYGWERYFYNYDSKSVIFANITLNSAISEGKKIPPYVRLLAHLRRYGIAPYAGRG